MCLRVLRAAGSKKHLILRGSCENHVNLRSDFVRVLRFLLLACAVFCWAPVFFLCGCVVLRFVFFLRLGGAFGPPWRIVGGARFGPPYRRDLLRLGLFGAPGPQCWYFLLLRRPCEGFLLRGAEFACFCAPGGLKQGSRTVKHL